MRYRIIKIIITVFVALLCSIMFISAKYYVRTVQSFKTFYKESEIRLTSMQNDCYNQLKKSLDDKYAKKLEELLLLTGNEIKGEIKNVLGEEYILLREEFYTTLNSIENKKKEFSLSNEYVSAKENLSRVKGLIDSAPEYEKDKYLDEFRVALNDISLLNTKLNNQLKSERDRLSIIKAEAKKLFIKNSKKLISVRKSLMVETRDKIVSLLNEYKFELGELNSTYNVKNNQNDLSFDFSSINERLREGKLESECFLEILSENSQQTVIVSENTNQILS